jgi:hypothetical protein
MIKAYKYLFYSFYRWSSRWKADVSPPEITAFLGIVVVVWWNALLLVEIAESVLRVPLLHELSIAAVLAVMALLAVPQYFVFLYRKRYKKIANEFEQESPRQSRVRGAAVWLYIVISFILLVGGAVVRSKVLNG